MTPPLTPDKVPFEKATDEDRKEILIHIGDYRVAEKDGWLYEMGYEYETYDDEHGNSLPNLFISAKPIKQPNDGYIEWFWNLNKRKWELI